jgi:hypothetical protein
MKMPAADKLYGTDANKETSIFEYGLLVAPFSFEGSTDTDEFFVIYRVSDDAFATTLIKERELNDIIEGKEFANEDDLEGFFAYSDTNKESWLELSFVQKLNSILSYWNCEAVMGTAYQTMTKEQVENDYL